MASRRRIPEYHEGPEAAKQFESMIGRVLTVSREELDRREAEHREANKDKPRRGPKPQKNPS